MFNYTTYYLLCSRESRWRDSSANCALPVPKVWRYASERERRTVHYVDGGGGDEKVKHSEGTTYRRDEVAIQKKACLLEQVHNVSWDERGGVLGRHYERFVFI